jgi:hypothetical protein
MQWLQRQSPQWLQHQSPIYPQPSARRVRNQVTANLVTASSLPAITINSPTAGKIILDLGGFTLSPGPSVSTTGVSIQNPTNSAVIVRNGTLTDFVTGIYISPDASASGFITNVKIQNITFLGELITSIDLERANGCAVNNCNFVGLPFHSESIYGIKDFRSSTGNSYSGNVFDAQQQFALTIGEFQFPGTLTIDGHVTSP